MANKIRIKRGLKVALPILDVGEPGLAIDTNDVFVGSNTGNIELARKSDIGGTGTGDMLRSVYDTDGDGKVNVAEVAESLIGVQASAITVNTAKVGITSAQATAITVNTAKVSNAAHTGEVSGSGALIVQSTAISNKPVKVAAGAEEILVNDGGVLRKTTAQDIANLGGGGGTGTGDMLRSVYDTDGDGKVNIAEVAESLIGVQASAIVANTAKAGITLAQASAIVVNSAKAGISPAQSAAIVANTAKAGITLAQASAITANTAKTGITTAQATAITINSAKVGISPVQATAITTNTAKVGISPAQSAAIVANTAKAGITSAQSSAIVANTAKIGITSAQASAIVANTAKAGITSAQSSAIVANTNARGKSRIFTTVETWSVIAGLTTPVPVRLTVNTKDLTRGTMSVTVDGGIPKTILPDVDVTMSILPNSSVAISSLAEITGSFDISTAIFNNSMILGTTHVDRPRAMLFSPGGLKLHFLDDAFHYRINTITLSLPYDISTFHSIVYGSLVLNQTSLSAMTFNNDGTKLYVAGSGDVVEYSLTTPYDVSTGILVGMVLTHGSVTIRTMMFNNTGTKLYLVIPPAGIGEHVLSTPYDIATSVSFTPDILAGSPWPINTLLFNGDGTILYAQRSQIIEQTPLTTPYDISTGTTPLVHAAWINRQGAHHETILFNGNGSKMFALAKETHNRIDSFILDGSQSLMTGKAFAIVSSP